MWSFYNKKKTVKLKYVAIIFLYVGVSDLSLLSTCLVSFLPCQLRTDCFCIRWWKNKHFLRKGSVNVIYVRDSNLFCVILLKSDKKAFTPLVPSITDEKQKLLSSFNSTSLVGITESAQARNT